MALQLSPAYRARRPTETALYRVLDEHLHRFFERVEAADRSPPDFVRRELEGLLTCGRLEFGFARQSCCGCSFERLVGFSCAGRGVCPSCIGRRMIEGAAHLVDYVLPDVPVRQFVLTLPVPLRFVLAYDATLASATLAAFIKEVSRWLRHTAKAEHGLPTVSNIYCGAVTAIHRVGGAGNLHLHYHSAFVDGVYVQAERGTPPVFHAARPPTGDDITEISARVYHRTRALFIAQGLDWEHPEEMEPEVLQQHPLLAACARASLRGVGLLGDRAGQRLLPFEPAALAIPADLRALDRTGGFNLQAARRIKRGDRKGLEKLCRYLLHPPFAHDRLELTDTGQVRLSFARPWRNGRDHIDLDPLDFIARLVPMIPLPRSNQLRYHGVLAPASPLRPLVIPPRPPDGAQLSLFDRRCRPTPAARGEATSSTSKMQRISWARLLKRMGGYEMDDCPECGRTLKVVEMVTGPGEIRAALEKRGLLEPLSPLQKAPSRGPPSGQLELMFS